MTSSSALIDNRQIRVFISSTFQDLQDERTELIRKTFPRLREMAAQRDVTLTEVDLRWGINKEDSESGKVMEICLREVQNSIPFFLGIIGNRYGWVPAPKDISDIVKERFPRVPFYIERHLSATEIEMQFGVLDRTDVNMNAYFFIKDGDLPDIDDPERLAALKKAVRENKKYPVSSYSTPEDLADQVLVAFTKLLDDLFPVGELSPLEKERLGQRAVLNNLSRVYIKSESNFAVIDKWMEDWDNHQLVITGASGLGKSALVANWIKEKLELGEELPYRIIYHFVGYGGSIGSDWHVIKALGDEIRDRYGFEAEESESKTDKNTLDDLFKRVAVEGDKPLLIVLDGINQIVDENHSKQLNWLPIPPRKIKILFTTLEDDETMGVFKDRHYGIFALQSLTREDRVAMVSTYLKETYSKSLQMKQLEHIVDDPQNVNTLVLKTLLDEISNFGSFEKLDEKIDEYLIPDSIGDFYQVVLKNYEADFGEEQVRHFLSLIAVSRNGLTEDEILEITNTKDKPILWSQFFCSFRQHMVVKNGLVSFAHSYIREAVEERYIKGRDEWAKTCREEIVAFLENQMTTDGKKTIRSMDEVPYQLDLLGDMPKLHNYLLELDVFSYLYKVEETTLGKYWWHLRRTGFSLSEYTSLINGKDNDLSRISLSRDLRLFNTTMKIEPQLSWFFLTQEIDNNLRHILGEFEKRFGYSYPNSSSLNYDSNPGPFTVDSYLLTVEHVLLSVKVCKQLYGESNLALAESYDNAFMVYSNPPMKFVEDYRKGIDCAIKSLEIRRSIFGPNHIELSDAYKRVSTAYWAYGCYHLRLENEIHALEIRKKVLGLIHPSVASSYDGLGYIYSDAKDYFKAQEFHQKAYEIGYELFGENHPDVATYAFNTGKICNLIQDYKGALKYHMKALDIRLNLYGVNHPDVMESYNAIAKTQLALGRSREAVEYKLRALDINKYLFGLDHPFIGKSYDEILSTYGEYGISVSINNPHGRIPEAGIRAFIQDGNGNLPDRVTKIGWRAFEGCEDLKALRIPDSVTVVEKNAFLGCSNLESIIVSPGNTSYDSRDNCNAIIEKETDTLVVGCNNTIIPNSVTAIADSAFYLSRGLKGIHIPDSIGSIGARAFYGCKGLKEIRIPNSVREIEEELFRDCSNLEIVLLHSEITKIGYGAFHNCSCLKDISLPDRITAIKGHLFYGCSNLINIHIPDSLTIIGARSFWGCSSLKEISIPNSVTSIGESAFSGCSSLTSMFIPENVGIIGGHAFDYTSLNSISVSSSNKIYDSRENCNAIIVSSKNQLVYGCNGTIIPDSVESIADYAFIGCTTLNKIYIPKRISDIGSCAFKDCRNLELVHMYGNAIKIGKNAFQGCIRLKEITLPEGISVIDGFSFHGCSCLTRIHIPSSVTGIGPRAFWGCSALKEIYIPDSVTTVGESAFEGCSGLKKVYLPKGLDISYSGIPEHAEFIYLK